MADMTIDQELKIYEQLKSDRSTLDNHLQEIARVVYPSYAESFFDNNRSPEGDKRNQHMFDATAALGLERFSAAMESMLTPRTQRWHFLTASDSNLMKRKENALWFEQATNILFRMRYASRSNYSSQQHENYMQMGAFGTGVLFVDQALDKSGFRYRSIPISDVFIVENFQGIVDKVYRRMMLSAEQTVEQFGIDNVSEEIRISLEKEPTRKFEIIHVVRPNLDLQPEKLDFRGKAFKSLYFEKDAKHQLEVGGYDTFPYSVNRYVTISGETYGRSPAMLALPAIKTLNKQKEHVLMQGERAVRPPMLTHDDGILDVLDLEGGAINPGGISADGRRLVQPMEFGGNLSVGFEMMNQERSVINDAFMVSLFQILTETPAMTATEVLERAREKGALIAPTMGRQQSEALAPLIEREMGILLEQNLLPEMPPELLEAQGDYEIIYDSPLTRSMKSEEASGVLRYMEVAGMHLNATGDQSMFDRLDPDTTGEALAKIFAVPPSYQRSEEQIQQVRESRAQQAQQQQMIEAAPAAAGLAKAMS